MKDGALVCNTGHYDCEINLVDLEARVQGAREIRPANEEYTLKDGRRVYVLAQGRLVNLAAAEGHPSEVMDMSFANQYLALCKLANDGKGMKPGVYELPPEQDQELARIKLQHPGPQHRRADRRSRSPTATTTPPAPDPLPRPTARRAATHQSAAPAARPAATHQSVAPAARRAATHQSVAPAAP